MKVVFSKPKIRFGNVWSFTSRMVLHGINNNLSEVYLSQDSRRIGWIEEMWDCFDTHGIDLKIINERPTTKRKFGSPEHKEPYAKTKDRWVDKKHNRICYQLDTDHNKRPEKLFKGDADSFVKTMEKEGYEMVELGLPLTVKESIKVASECDAFVGICSGMAHVCHSVGVPVFLQDWNQLDKFHPNKTFTKFQNEQDIINKLGNI